MYFGMSERLEEGGQVKLVIWLQLECPIHIVKKSTELDKGSPPFASLELWDLVYLREIWCTCNHLSLPPSYCPPRMHGIYHVCTCTCFQWHASDHNAILIRYASSKINHYVVYLYQSPLVQCQCAHQEQIKLGCIKNGIQLNMEKIMPIYSLVIHPPLKYCLVLVTHSISKRGQQN